MHARRIKQCLISNINNQVRNYEVVAHTTSRCCSPLMSMASRLRIEHGREGKVTSNCNFRHQQGIDQLLKQYVEVHHRGKTFSRKYITYSTELRKLFDFKKTTQKL